MPIYDWKCQKCEHVTQVLRKMADYLVPPDDGCEKCQSKELDKIIPEWKPEQTILVPNGKAPWFFETHINGKPNGR